MDEAAKQKLRAAIDKGLGDWLKEGQCHEPTCGCETVWVEDEMFPIIDSLLTEAQAAALAMAAKAVMEFSDDMDNGSLAAKDLLEEILALSPLLDVTRYIERLRLEGQLKEAQHWQKQIAHKIEFKLVVSDRLAALERQLATNAETKEKV